MSADLVPVVDAADIERAADPARFVVQTLERAKTWLSTALEHGELMQIAELKSQAEAMRVYAMSKQLGKDAELSAAEIVRRAERGIGLCIRRGQREGTIAVPHKRRDVLAENITQLSPRDVLGNGGQTVSDTYAMTDEVDDELFEAAIRTARATGNMSRRGLIRRIEAERHVRTDRVEQAEAVWSGAWDGSAPESGLPAEADEDDELWIPPRNVSTPKASAQRQKLISHYAGQGYTSGQISDYVGLIPGTVRRIAREAGIEIPADAAMGRGTHKGIDHNRIVRETASTLDALVMGVGLVDVNELDPAEINDWARSISTSIRALNRLIKQMRERTQ